MKIIFLLILTIWTFVQRVDCKFEWNSDIEATELQLKIAERDALIKHFGKNAETSNDFLNYQNFSEIIGKYIDVDKTRFRNHNYEEMVKIIKLIRKKCPHITHLYSIGKSVQGKELWVLVVSKNPRKHTLLKPEFNYVGNIHGNEVLGRELLLLLAELLCKNYKKNKYLRELVNEVRIHMLFSMNPDGYALSKEGDMYSGVGRYNGNGIDLNRNFPSQYPDHVRINGGDKPDVETENVMKWMKAHPFVLSASMHGGALVAHYPFDDNFHGRYEEYAATVDDKLFVQLAYQYARAHVNMWKTGRRCGIHPVGSIFYHGITNGADWYPIPGALDDWQYLNTNAFGITLELNCQKFPFNNMYETLWEHNKYALISYIDMARYGIKGIVKSSSGEPLENAKVEVNGGRKGKAILTTSEGEYWRLLAPGIYTIKFSHPNHRSKVWRVCIKARKLKVKNIILTRK